MKLQYKPHPQKQSPKQPQKLSPFDWSSLTPAPIVGVDEVGRGCLAGDVYAAAVIINPEKNYSEYTDSKALTPKKRQILSEHIRFSHQFCIAMATVEEIDELNILQASLLAMRRAVLGLGIKSGHVIVDGHFSIPDLKGFVQTPLIKGDLRAAPVAAASIIAKVERDRVMNELEEQFPGYGLHKHKGYATETHRSAIEKLGPSKIHRKSFGGVKEYVR